MAWNLSGAPCLLRGFNGAGAMWALFLRQSMLSDRNHGLGLLQRQFSMMNSGLKLVHSVGEPKKKKNLAQVIKFSSQPDVS